MFNKKQWLALAVTGLLVLGPGAGLKAAAPDTFSVTADELDYDFQTGEGEAKGNVILLQNGGKATAKYASFNSKTKKGTLTGGVVADREDMHIVCEKFIINDLEHFSAANGAVLTKAGRTVSADQIDYDKQKSFAKTVGGWAKLTDTDGSVLNCGKLDYNHQTGIANAYGNVTIDSPARNLTASADKAVYRAGEGGSIDLYGNATATQNGNKISGSKLHLTNTNRATADGDVKIYYVPEKPIVAVADKKTKNNA